MRWLPPLLVAFLVEKVKALVQVSIPNKDHLTVLEASRRTGQSAMAAEVSGLGEVGLHIRQNPGVISGLGDQTVYGSFMIITVTPKTFAQDPTAQMAAKDGIELVAVASTQEVKDVGVSLTWLEEFPQAVLVEFQVAFHTVKARQVFTRNVTSDGSRTLVRAICGTVRVPFRGRCELPGASQLDRNDEHAPMSLVNLEPESPIKATVAVLSAMPKCYGTFTLNPQGPPQQLVQDRRWQEAVAMAISNVASVSRPQVGTLMAVVGNLVRVDFWLIRRNATCYKATISQVTASSNFIGALASEQMHGWRVNSEDQVKEFPVYGRMMLKVPNPELFVESMPSAAAQQTLAQIAVLPGREEKELSLTNVTASFAAMGNASDAVRVGFRAAFAIPKDRQVYSWDFAQDGGQKLANGVNELVPVCEMRCHLPGQRLGQAGQTPSAPANELRKQYGSLGVWAPRPRLFASDVLAQDAMAIALSEIAAVPQEQVGLLAMPEYRDKVRVDYWMASSTETLRQAALARVKQAGRSQINRCVLAHLDRLHDQVSKAHQEHLVRGSIVLHVPNAESFARSTPARYALRTAVAELAAVPIVKVERPDYWLNLWEENPQLVRIDFGVRVDTQGRGENFTRAIAMDGGAKLVNRINALVPTPFKGRFLLPVLKQSEASAIETVGNASIDNPTVGKPDMAASLAGNATGRLPLGQQYGTMLLYMLYPEVQAPRQFVREAAARTIAEVASVPRPQVGVIFTVRSPVLLRIDFWVTSTNATLRQAAVQRVSTNWTQSHLDLLWQRFGFASDNWPVFLVSGGTMSGGMERYSCHGAGS